MVLDFEDMNDPRKLLDLGTEAVAFRPDSFQVFLELATRVPLLVGERLGRALLGFGQRVEEVFDTAAVVPDSVLVGGLRVGCR